MGILQIETTAMKQISKKKRMNALCRATWRTQATKLSNTTSDHLKTFEAIEYSEVSGSLGMESKISLYLKGAMRILIWGKLMRL